MKKFWIIFLLAISLNAQVTKSDVKEVLEVYMDYVNSGICELEVEKVYDLYMEKQQFNTQTGINAALWSTAAGVSLGAYEAYLFGYTKTQWLPKPIAEYYKWRPQTDAVYGKSLTWHKIFRSIDYSSDRAAFNNWKRFFGVKSFLSWNQLAAYLVHFTVKNTAATIVRDKFKFNEAFHSFDMDLVFDFSDLIR